MVNMIHSKLNNVALSITARSRIKMTRNKTVENKVLKAVRESSEPQELTRLAKQVPGDEGSVRRAITSLVDLGRLQVTLDWKLREVE